MHHIMSPTELKSLFEHIKQFSDQHSPGVNRLAYSDVDQQLHQFILHFTKQQGLIVRQDAIGNIFARLPGSKPHLPAIGSGSHLDSVPQGGAYDGVAGVVAMLYALSHFQPGQLKRSIELVVFRAEESSRFSFACMGSKVMTGQADLSVWQQQIDAQGKTFLDALTECGYHQPDLASCCLSTDYFSAFIELHIEQGKVLEVHHKQLGVVTGIAAPCRFRVTVQGQADHSGATPMAQRYDALVPSAAIITDLHRAATQEAQYGTVGTVGKLEVTPNAMNVIPGQVVLYVDIRGIDVTSIQRVIHQLHSSIAHNQQRHRVTIQLDCLAQEQPVLLDHTITQLIAEECEHLQLSWMTLISGAGHDAMYLANLFPTGMIFIPSIAGISHHPDEYSDFDDLIQGAIVLKNCLARLANQ